MTITPSPISTRPLCTRSSLEYAPSILAGATGQYRLRPLLQPAGRRLLLEHGEHITQSLNGRPLHHFRWFPVEAVLPHLTTGRHRHSDEHRSRWLPLRLSGPPTPVVLTDTSAPIKLPTPSAIWLAQPAVTTWPGCDAENRELDVLRVGDDGSPQRLRPASGAAARQAPMCPLVIDSALAAVRPSRAEATRCANASASSGESCGEVMRDECPVDARHHSPSPMNQSGGWSSSVGLAEPGRNGLCQRQPRQHLPAGRGRFMSFHSLYEHGFARVAACTADVYLADPVRNAAASLTSPGDAQTRASPSRCSRSCRSPATRWTICSARTPFWMRFTKASTTFCSVQRSASVADRRSSASPSGTPVQHCGGDPPR